MLSLRSVLQLCVAAQFYLENSRKNPSARREGMPNQRRKEKRVEECASAWERDPRPIGPSFYDFPPPGPALCKLGSPGELFVLPEVLILVLRPSFDLLLCYFQGLFPSSSFSHCHSRLMFPTLPT